jgi:peroxiredoxin
MTTQAPKKKNSVIITLIAGGIFLIGAALLPLLEQARDSAIDVSASIRLPAAANYAAPELSLSDLQGNSVSLEDHRGQVVLVNNWATWCPPCKAEMPALQSYFSLHAGEGLVVVAIESGEAAADVAAFVDQYGLTFPVWLDPQGAALEAFRNWNLPSTYIIDRTGTVVYSWTGEVNLETLETYVTPLLEN